MGERWLRGWTRTVATRRRALRGLGSAMAATASVGVSRQAALAVQAEATPAEVPDNFKVVLHAAEMQDWIYVLSNLRNLTQEWPRARLRVVVDGSAVLGLQGENSLTRELAAVASRGVEVMVCPNALREHEIDPTTIPPYASTTLGGVVALVQAHNEGFVYVKP